MTEIPLFLRRAGEEMLLALGAESAEDEALHRALADELTATALRDIERAPNRRHDWSLLSTAG
jgi:hypothetical protein